MKKTLSIIGIVVFIVLSSIIFKTCNTAVGVVDKVVNPDAIVNSYEEFQAIYNTTQSICTKIGTLEQLPDDYNSGGFTKIERIIGEQNNLARWVEEYNAKSKMMTKNLWKSGKLPYQLDMSTVCY
jgi:predicted small secreted protein